MTDPRHMTAGQLQGDPQEYGPDNWAHQALLKMDVAHGLVNWACVSMDKERYDRTAGAFWDVIHMLTDERQRIEDARLSGMAAAVPDGWKLVPIEPNWDMRNEGRELLIDGIEKEPERLAYFLWKTMIAAAPEPPHG